MAAEAHRRCRHVSKWCRLELGAIDWLNPTIFKHRHHTACAESCKTAPSRRRDTSEPYKRDLQMLLTRLLNQPHVD